MVPVPVPTRLGEMLVPDTQEDVIGRFLHHYGEWAWDEVGFVASVLREGARVLDIGAFVGTFGLGLAARKPLRSVCFVEASAVTAPLLRANVAANCPCPATIVEALVIGATGLDLVGRAEAGNLGSTSFAANAAGDVSIDGVPDQVTLAELREQHGPFDLIKLDVEGLEFDILAADVDFLRKGETAIWAECNDTSQSLLLVELLLSLGKPVYYFAFPSHNPDNHNASKRSIFPMAYEAGLLAAPLIEPSLGAELSRHGCILKVIGSVGDLKEVMWRTPRWGFVEWEAASHAEVVALAGHVMCGDGFDRYLQPAWKPGEPLTQRLTRAETALETVQQSAAERCDQLMAEREAAQGLRHALDIAERDTAARQAEALGLRAELAQREGELEALQAQLEALSSKSESEREAARRRFEEVEQLAAAQRNDLTRQRERIEAAEAELARMAARFLDQKSWSGRAKEQIELLEKRAAAADRRAIEAETLASLATARAHAAESEAERAEASTRQAKNDLERAMVDRAGALRRAEEADDRLAQLRPVRLGRLPLGLYRDTSKREKPH